MAETPKISVCVATYNQAAYIEDCVTSVLSQAKDVRLELLVGDDASVDRTGEILRALEAQYPGQITAIIRPVNLGGTENYQDLVRRATGDFIAHLDGDDAWLPGKLLAQARFLAAQPQCSAVYTNAVVVDSAGHEVGTFTNTHPPVMDLAYVAAKGNFLMHSSMLYRARHKEIFLALAPPVIDYQLHLELAKAGPLGYVNRPLSLYRRGTATSQVRNSFPAVQRLLWSAIRGVLRDLEPNDRRDAVAHFAGEILIATLLGKAGDAGMLLDEAAAQLESSRRRLMVQSIPHVVAIVLHRAWQRALEAAGARDRVIAHARL
jgi:glycosyltransferase involved in cell wall biosynthesis